MDYSTNIRAIGLVIAHIAGAVNLERMRESCTHSAAEIRMYEWWIARVGVHTSGGKVTLTYPARVFRSTSRADAWATSLIERGLELVEGSPYTIDYRVGEISWDRPGVTSYTT